MILTDYNSLSCFHIREGKDYNSIKKMPVKQKKEHGFAIQIHAPTYIYKFASCFNSSALSVCSHGNSTSVRPK